MPLQAFRNRKRRTGFTLIEVALAVMVAAMGVLAVFALISSALHSSAKAMADTQTGLFAKDVFNGLRSRSVVEASGGGVAWNTFWNNFAAGTETITVASRDAWQTPGGMIINGNGAVHSLTFVNSTFRLPSELTPSVEDHIISYRLTVAKRVGGWQWDTRTVTLEVWEGSAGLAGSGIIYYSEFMDPGDL